MDASKIESSLEASVTCSLCLNLYDTPKMMPECLHTFCLDCLKSLTIDHKQPGLLTVACPECRTVSTMPISQSVENFKTNIVVQNIVDLIKAEEAKHHEKDGSTSCKHISSLTKDRSQCTHCNKTFCTPCRVYHMEELRFQALELCTKAVDECFSVELDEKLKAISDLLDREAASAEMKVATVADTIRTAFDASLSKNVDNVKQEIGELKAKHAELLKVTIENLADRQQLAAIAATRDEVKSSSLLKQTLEQIANFHSKITERSRSVAYLESVMKADKPLFEFEIHHEINDHLSAFDTFTLGQIRVNNLGNNTDSSKSELSETSAADSENPNDLAEKSRPPADILECNHPVYVNIPGAIAVVAIPSKRMFGFLDSHDKFTLVNANDGSVHKQLRIRFSTDVISHTCFNLAFDEESESIFVSAEVETRTTKSKRRIYRFWLRESSPIDVEPFSRSVTDGSHLRGIAVSQQFNCVFTTIGSNFVALTSTQNEPGVRAKEQFLCVTGPDSYVHGLTQRPGGPAHVICSSKGHLLDVVVAKGTNGMYSEGRRTHGFEMCKNVQPSLVSVWHSNLIASKGYWLKRLSSIHDNAKYHGAISPGFNWADSPYLESFTAFAVMQCPGAAEGELKEMIAFINPDCRFVTVATLPTA